MNPVPLAKRSEKVVVSRWFFDDTVIVCHAVLNEGFVQD